MLCQLAQVIFFLVNPLSILSFAGLRGERRPTWLALIVLFFSDRMRDIWTRLVVGIVVGITCDQLSNSDQFFARL